MLSLGRNRNCLLGVIDSLPTASRGDTIFLIDATPDDANNIVRQWPLQRLRLIPRRAHPYVAFFFGRQDHRHGFGMDRPDDGIR
jgi:hypothetical protein